MKVLVTLAGTPCCDMELTAYLQEMEEVYSRSRPFQILYNASHVGVPSAQQLKQQVSFMRRFDECTRRLVDKCAIVVTSMVARASLRTIFLLKPPACPMSVFSTLSDAKEYLSG